MALALLGLGGVLGAVGQGARVVVGLKKDWEAASKDDRLKELDTREEELHVEIRRIVTREKEIDKALADLKATQSTTQGQTPPSPGPLNAELESISQRKERLLREKAVVLDQRRTRRWFSGFELFTSLLIAFVVGAIAGMLAGMAAVDSDTGIDQKTMLTIIGAGYAGTDFIEGFMKSSAPYPK